LILGFEVSLKEWKCVQVGDYKNIGEVIQEWQKEWLASPYLCLCWNRGNDVCESLLVV